MRAFLRNIPLFADLDDADLDRICEDVTERSLAAGEVLFREGDRGDEAFVVRSGEVEIVKAAGKREVLLAVRGRGDVIGEMALLEDTERMATVRARSDCELVVIDRRQLDRLVRSSATAAATLFHTLLVRSRATEAQLRHSEKMAQLGTLTAGVAHELNNPAAAIARSADQMAEALDRLAIAETRLSEAALSPTESEALRALSERLTIAAPAGEGPEPMGALERSDRAAGIEAWLAAHGVPEPWRLASDLAEVGIERPALDAAADAFAESDLGVVLDWLCAARAPRMLAAEIVEASARISAIVGALKSYTYLDRGATQAVQVNRGLDDTLLVLRGKMKDGIEVVRDYDAALPAIEGYGSELNQVWTNLIDNAADALAGTGGTITLTTRREGDGIVVQVIDDGPGVPEDIRDRVFDPFFTTKPPGQGTGLGLDISYGIVVNRHRGELRLASRPGRTVFEVRLPLGRSD